MPSIVYESGSYVGEVVAQGIGKTQTGKPQLALRFRVLGTPAGDTIRESYQQYERTIYWVITEKTISYVADKLARLGYSGKGFGPFDPEHPQHQSFAGQQIDVFCQHEPNQNGEMREKWDLSRGTSELTLERLNPKEMRELDALFGKALKPAPKAEVKPRPAAVSVPAEPVCQQSAAPNPAAGAFDSLEITDDDIPF